MTLNDLQKLISQGESSTLEFKRSTTQLKGAGQTLCAFLNNEGGTVVIGVSDKGKIIGQHITDNTRKEIAHMLKLLEPYPAIDTEYISLHDNDKYLIVLSTKSNHIAPYIFDGCPYIRNQSTTTKMKQEHYQEILLDRLHNPKPWDLLPAKNITIDDLDGDEILLAIQEGILQRRIKGQYITDGIKKALIHLKLLRNDVPINAAVVLFAKDVFPDYSQCLIRMARFKGISKSEFIDNQQEFGNFFYLLDTAEEFVRRHTPVAGRLELGKMKRTDTPLVPSRAVREAIINALCHRDYTISNGSISIGIYDDRLEITSPGRLPKEMTLEKLKMTHESHPRNKEIARVLYRCGFIEHWGSGTEEMINLCAESGLPEPEFIEDDNTFIVRFRANFAAGRVKQAEQDYSQLTKRQQEILTILKVAGDLTVNEIANKMVAPPAKVTIRKHLLNLKNLNLVDSIGHAKTAKWKIVI